MNTSSRPPFAASLPELRLARRTRFAPDHALGGTAFRPDDLETLRAHEKNLRDYEDHLLEVQGKLESSGALSIPTKSSATPFTTSPFAGSTTAPFPGAAPSYSPFARKAASSADATLNSAWERIHRARVLLESEQSYLRDEREALKAREQALEQREKEVALRECSLAKFDSVPPGALAGEAVSTVEPESALARITRAPFEMARSIFRRDHPADDQASAHS